jgi:hypothetical protein
VQPCCSPTLYPAELSSTIAAKTSPVPNIIEDDCSTSPNAIPAPSSLVPSLPLSLVPSSSNSSVDNLSGILARLQSLADAILSLQAQQRPPVPLGVQPPPQSDNNASTSLPVLASTMSQEDIISILHRNGSSLPAVRHCDTANNSDTKTHWTSEEIHRAMGCRKFKNYRTLLQVSRDGQWVDGREFPPALGSFATIPKAKCSGPLDWTNYKYLDAVHMDIAFGDCLLVGGYKYALILVDRATRYNWTFGLESLCLDNILGATRLFHASVGGLARCFYCDCDAKLFGTAISEYLIDNESKVVATPAKRQSSNGLVEAHWKIMVHMARAYLTEEQMPRTYWFFAVTHVACMMNAIPGNYGNKGLALPFLLVHSVGHDQRTWVPLFSLCFFHHIKDGDDTRTKHMAHTMDGVIVGRSPTSNTLMVYNPRNKQYYKPDTYCIDSYRLPCSMYPTLKYDGGLFVNLLWALIPLMKKSTLLVLG